MLIFPYLSYRIKYIFMSNCLTLTSSALLFNIQINSCYWNFLNINFEKYLFNYFLFFQQFFCKFIYGKFIEFTLLLSSDKFSHSLNIKHQNTFASTDTLSFTSQNTKIILKNNYIFIGEIIISFENILRKSVIYNESFYYSLFRVIMHSFLHLLGYCHVTYYSSFIIKLFELRVLYTFKFIV